MARVCDISGKKTIVGNNLSHSHIRTKRKFFPNLQLRKMFYPEKNCWVFLRLSANSIKTINKFGLDTCLRKAHRRGTLAPHLVELL